MYAALNTVTKQGRNPSGLGEYSQMTTDITSGVGPQFTSDTPDVAIDPDSGNWWSPMASFNPPETNWVPWAVGGAVLLLLMGAK
jgi:hypothetical protein